MKTLQDHRIAAGLTLRKVGAAIASNEAVVCNWERGHTDMRLSSLERLAELYRVPLGEIAEAARASRRAADERAAGTSTELQ